MNNNETCVGTFLGGLFTGAVVLLGIIAFTIDGVKDRCYAKGIKDKTDNTMTYEIKVSPTGIDTVYIYKQ